MDERKTDGKKHAEPKEHKIIPFLVWCLFRACWAAGRQVCLDGQELAEHVNWQNFFKNGRLSAENGRISCRMIKLFVVLMELTAELIKKPAELIKKPIRY